MRHAVVIIIITLVINFSYFILWEDTREVSITKSTTVVSQNVDVGDLCRVAASGKIYEGKIAAIGILYIYYTCILHLYI